MTVQVNRIAWLSDLVRLEINLWNRVDARLQAEHDLSLAAFSFLDAVAGAARASMRVGEIASALGLTVGGTSKVVDRIERAGLMRREADPDDRRASRVVLTAAGRRKLDAATATCTSEVALALDAALNPDEQRTMHEFVKRLLGASAQP